MRSGRRAPGELEHWQQPVGGVMERASRSLCEMQRQLSKGARPYSDGPAWRTMEPCCAPIALPGRGRVVGHKHDSAAAPPSHAAGRRAPAPPEPSLPAAARPSCQPSRRSLRQVPAASLPAATAAAARLWHGSPPPPLQLGCRHCTHHVMLGTCYMLQGLAAVCCRTCRHRRRPLARSLPAAATSPVPTPVLQDGLATAVRGTQQRLPPSSSSSSHAQGDEIQGRGGSG